MDNVLNDKLENRKDDPDQKVQPRLTALGLVVIFLIASLPLMVDYCLSSHDLSFYLKSLGVMDGDRLLLVLPTLMVRLGLSAETVYHLLLAVINVVTIGNAYVCFYKLFGKQVLGVLGCALYSWMPYRLNILYVRGDLGEALSLCFLPLLLWGIYQIYESSAEEKNSHWVWVMPALAFTGVLQAYLRTFVLAGMMVLLFAVLQWRRTIRKPCLLTLGKVVLAVGILNSWFLLPYGMRLLRGQAVLWPGAGRLIQEKGVYLIHYLIPFFRNGDTVRVTHGMGMIDGQPLGMGFGLTVSMLLFLWMLFTGKLPKKMDSFGRAAAWTGAIFLIGSLGSFPWDVLQSMNKLFAGAILCLQSPSSLIPFVTLCFAYIACRVFSNVGLFYRYALTAVAVAALVSAQYLAGDIVSSRPAWTEEQINGADRLELSPLDYARYYVE